MMSDNDDLLRTAAEQFLGKGEQEIEDTIIQVKFCKFTSNFWVRKSKSLLEVSIIILKNQV